MICLQNIIASLYLHSVWYFYIDDPSLMLPLILELHKTQLRLPEFPAKEQSFMGNC